MLDTLIHHSKGCLRQLSPKSHNARAGGGLYVKHIKKTLKLYSEAAL
jgi:hypothetical protein